MLMTTKITSCAGSKDLVKSCLSIFKWLQCLDPDRPNDVRFNS